MDDTPTFPPWAGRHSSHTHSSGVERHEALSPMPPWGSGTGAAGTSSEPLVDPALRRAPATDTAEWEAAVACGTTVLTAAGAVPVERLQPGDIVITRRGDRPLKSLLVHTLPAGEPRIVITAGILGGRPARDVTLIPQQKILLRDCRAMLIWGKDVAAPPVERIVDGTFIRREVGGPLIMVSLFFGQPELIYAEGLELASADKLRTTIRAGV